MFQYYCFNIFPFEYLIILHWIRKIPDDEPMQFIILLFCNFSHFCNVFVRHQGAHMSDNDNDLEGAANDPHKLLNINLDEWVGLSCLSLSFCLCWYSHLIDYWLIGWLNEWFLPVVNKTFVYFYCLINDKSLY